MRKVVIIAVAGILIAGGAGAAAFFYIRNSGDHYERAMQAVRAGDSKRAQIELRNAVRDSPNDPNVHYQLGTLELRLGDVAAAEKDLRAALALGYDAAAAKPALARTYLAQQHYKELLADFPAIDSPQQLAARIDTYRALAYARLNDFDSAAKAIVSAEKHAPELVDIPMTAAQIALSRQDRVTADREIDAALKIEPQNVSALILKADLQRARGERAAALKSLNTALADAPDNRQALLARADFYIGDNRDADAKADVDKVMAGDPQNVMGTYLRGILQTRAKDFAAADATLNKVTPYAAQLPRSLYFSAIAKSNIGETEQARDAASRYVARAGGDTDGVKLLARIAINSKQPGDAIRALNDSIVAGRGDAEMLDLLGRAYALSGRPQDAVSNFEKAAALSPENSDILRQLASARADLGPVGPSDSGLQTVPQQGTATEASILSAIALGDYKRAATELQAFKAGGGNPEAVADFAARLKIAQLDLDGARTDLTAALKQFPESTRLRIDMARVAELQLHPDEVEKWLTEILQRQPANEPALAGVVALLVNSGRVARAIQYADAARKAAPSNPAFPALVADLQVRAGDGQTALTTLKAVPPEMQTAAPIMGARARAQVALNQRTDAIQTYRDILAAHPEDLNARARLTELLLADNNREGARQVVLAGLKQSPRNLPMMELLVRMAAQAGGLDAGLAQADAFQKDPAALPEARALKGDLYMSDRKPADAATEFANQFRADPTAFLASRLAAAQVADGKMADAEQTLGDWTANHANDLPLLLQLSSVQISASHYDAAAKTLERILALRPNEAAAANNLAWIYGMQKKPQAVDLARRAFALSPTPDVADTLGWNLTQDGKAAEALPLLKLAAERSPKNYAIQYHYGIALRDTGDAAGAEKQLGVATAEGATYTERSDAEKALADLKAKH